MADGILTPSNVACGAGITTVNSPSGSTLQLADGSGMIYDWIRPNVRHIEILHIVLISTTSPQSTCHSLTLHQSAKIYPNWTTLGRKNDVMSIFKMADLSHLGFYGSNNGFLKCPCTTSCRSSIDTIALNCLVFEKIAFLYFDDRQTNKQTNKLTNRWRAPMHWAALAVASGGLINNGKRFIMNVSEMKK